MNKSACVKANKARNRQIALDGMKADIPANMGDVTGEIVRKAGGGKASLTTVNGGALTAAMVGKKLVLTDTKGTKSTVTIANVMQSNGVIHVVDTVVQP